MSVRPTEIKALAGARAIPALMIVLFHFDSAHGYVPFDAVLGPPAMKGYLWVEFFFALSGFLLLHVYGEGGKPLRYGAFLKARLARLYPVHFVTLITMVALVAVRMMASQLFGFVSHFPQLQQPLNTPATFVANLLLVQGWNIVPGLSWNGAAWFVSVEFLLCLIFPLVLIAARGGAWRGAGMIGAGIAWLALLEWNSGVGLDITFDNGMFRGMAGFAIGAGMALIYRALRTRAEIAPDAWYSAAQGVVLVAILAAIYCSGQRHSRADIFTALAFDALVLAVAFDKGFLARLFQTAPFQTLSAWSYGIYMGQTFWMQVVRQFDSITRVPHTGLYRIGEPLVLLAICVLWGALLTRFVERPAHTFLHRIAP